MKGDVRRVKGRATLLSFFITLIFLAGFTACGENRKAVEHECISFTLGSEYDYAFLDAETDPQRSDFPLGNNLRAVIWHKDSPHAWRIFIYFPLPSDISDSLNVTGRRNNNGVEVLISEISGFYLQAYLHPIMGVGISSISDEASIREARLIMDSLKVKKAMQDLP